MPSAAFCAYNVFSLLKRFGPYRKRKNAARALYRVDLARSIAESSGITVQRMVM